MSGIAGILRLDGRALQAFELKAMAQAMAHRGPDGIRVWVNGTIGLGHNRLCTKPKGVRDPQPLRLTENQLVVTCDARIDNRDELLKLLSIKRPGVEVSDSELILYAYARWGENCPERLSGDFTFAIWDERCRKVFCARDRLGVKPFLYCHIPGHVFIFATEIRALAALPEVPKRVNEWAIAQLFEPTLEGFDKSATFYQDINKLEPACTLTVGESTFKRRQYWALDPHREVRFARDEDYVEAYREVFNEAVRCRIRGLDRVGVLLSGGIDSNSVLATVEYIGRVSGQEVHTLSAVAEKNCPERPYMDATLRPIPVVSHFVHSGQVCEFLSDFDHALIAADEPVEMTRHYTTRILWRVAQQNGICVVLSGVDGDMATTPGYGISYLLATGRWMRALRESAAAGRRNNLSAWSFLKSEGLRPLAPDLVVRAWDRYKGRCSASANGFMNGEYCKRVHLEERLRNIARQFSALASPRVNQARFATCGILGFAYEQQDISASRIGIEPRHPFSDHRLLEFCLAVPRDQVIRDGYVKALLRRAADPRVPDEIRWRSARPTVGPWFMREFARHRRGLFEEVRAQADYFGRYVSAAGLESTYRKFVDCQDNMAMYLLFSTAYLMSWMRHSSLTG
ncbi:MAG TPA: asparagine synthase-related protein [Terriglobales bacterium]|nr:asparagine synthase-related protein [Terriglobales bacterium]